MKKSFILLTFLVLFIMSGVYAQDNEITKEASSSEYVKNHATVTNPYELLGGPVHVTINQESGGVHVALPAYRELDPLIFGTPAMPKKFGGTPVVAGVPLKMRDKEGDRYTKMNTVSPFGNKYMIMKNGKLSIDAMDVTATDAAKTDDKVKMDASWQDDQGNTYEIKCCDAMASHGIDYPTFGGVVTNVILHGFSGIGTPLMPSEYTYFAFWGMGKVLKNGKVLDEPRLIHGMLTEYVRKEDYKLAWDKGVTPEKRHFHLISVPMKPDMKNFSMSESPVNTGFNMKNGKTLPFWHVMFDDLTINSDRK